MGILLPREAHPPTQCTHITIGSQIEFMLCQQYDELINQNFRRSGCFLYKGDMLRGCCRMYTIRTDFEHLKITKEHRQTVNRFCRAILPAQQSDETLGKEGTETHDKRNNSAANRQGAIKNTGKSLSKRTFSLASLREAEVASTNFHTRFEPSLFSDEKFELYRKYQITVHNDEPDEVTEQSFRRFLCDTPFSDHEVNGTSAQWNALKNRVPAAEHPESHRIGPTHECYYLDDKLIAVLVLDFLPSGVSSIYFIWDPDYAHLSLGTLLGLREIAMCNEMGLGFYYLGYYIHDCPKMRYKAKFGGEVLDVCNEAYVELDAVIPLLKDGRFFLLEDESNRDGTENLQTSISEPHMTRFGKPTKWTAPVRDASENIYGKRDIYSTAAAALEKLASKFDVRLDDLPLVTPGLVPLPQILEWFEDGTLDLDFPIKVFQTSTGKFFNGEFKALTAGYRGNVVDCIRLYGIEKAKNMVVLV